MKKCEYYEMTYIQRELYKDGILKKAKIYSIASLVGIGCFLGSTIFLCVNGAQTSDAKDAFMQENNINYKAYVQEVKEEKIEELQASVVAQEISFEEYENTKNNIQVPSEEEYLKTLEPSVANKYKELDAKSDKSVRDGFGAVLASAGFTVSMAVMSDRKEKEYKILD